jgi:hypothetical protein
MSLAVAQQLDLADSILVVSGARYHTIQPAHLGLDVHLNYTLTIRYLMLKARMVGLLFLLEGFQEL